MSGEESQDNKEWRSAMQEEIDAIEEMRVRN